MTLTLDTISAADSILALLDKHEELTTRQLKTKTGISGNRLDEALRFLKGNSRIFMTTDNIYGVTHWRLNRGFNAAALDAVFSEPSLTPAPAQHRKPYTTNNVSGDYRQRAMMNRELLERALAALELINHRGNTDDELLQVGTVMTEIRAELDRPLPLDCGIATVSNGDAYHIYAVPIAD